MKLIHLSDLHLGKRLNEQSLLEDQEYILKKIQTVIRDEAPDAVLIAGDIYDKSVPSAEAVALFDEFLVSLAGKTQVFIISGNHDSAERLAFGGRLMAVSGVHLSPVYNGSVAPVTLQDEHGPVNIYLLPFIKPAHVRAAFPEETIASYTDAMRVAIDRMNVDTSARNVLVTHQFVTGAERSESEEVSVGGSDNVDISVFAPFDYVALGHIHGPQCIDGCEHIRYCGTPLKYSFSEKDHRKAVAVVELGEKGVLSVRETALEPLHDMYELSGTYNELMSKAFYDGKGYEETYTRIILKDEDDIPDAMNRLRTVYHRLMKLDYDNTRTRTQHLLAPTADEERKSPLQRFEEFFEAQNNRPMSEEQQALVQSLCESIWEENA